MDPIAITLTVLVVAIVVFVWNRVPVGIVAIGVALVLYGTGVLSFDQAMAGFGDPVVVFIAALFVVSEGLDATGVTTWAGQQLIDRAGTNPRRLVSFIMILVAMVTALISVNGAVAALIPMVVVLAIRAKKTPSQFLMPLAFGAHAGSLLVMTGTPVNVLVSELAEEAGARPFGFFEFGLVGIPLLIGTIGIVLLLGPRLLPKRNANSLARDLSGHAQTLADHYNLGDEVIGISREQGLTEVLIPPRSEMIGYEVFPGMVTESGDLVVVAIHRSGENLDGTSTLAAGDTLLLRGNWTALDENTVDPNVVVVDSPQSIRRQAVPMGPRAKTALVILAGMVLLLATGIVPPAVAALLAACAMVLLRVLTVQQAHRSISWTTLILVGGI